MQFYRDHGDERVARLAKAICVARGHDPYALVKDSGYQDAPLIPAWWRDQDFARNFLACRDAVQSGPVEPGQMCFSIGPWTAEHLRKVAGEILEIAASLEGGE